MALKLYEFQDGSQYELDISNPEHKRWMEQKAAAVKTPAWSPEKEQAFADSVSPVADNSFLENLRAGTGRGMSEFVRGIRTLPGFPNQWKLSPEEIKESRKLDAPLMATGGGMIGSGVGQAAPAMMLPAAQTLRGATAAGAALGYASPVESETERFANTGFGAAGGAVAAGTAKTIGATTKAAYRALSPYLPGGLQKIEGKAFRAVAGDKTDDVIKALESSREIVPGSLPTAGEASVAAQSPQFAALQDILERGFATEKQKPRFDAQEAARMALLGRVAGDKTALKTAEEIRNQITGPMREQALASANKTGLLGGKPFQDGLDALMSSPENITNATAQSALGEVKAMIANATKPDGSIDARSLYTLRKTGIANTIEKYADANKTTDKRFTAGLLRDIQKVIDDAIEMAGGKGWKNYLQTYARTSERPDQMRIGQYLQEKLQGPKGEERATMFLNALSNAPKTLKQSVNFRGDDLSKYLRPDQMQSVTAISDDLLRQAEMSRLAKGGTEETQRLLQSLFKPIDLPGILDPKMTFFRWITKNLQGAGGEREMHQMAIDMLNPARVAELMRNAAPKDRPALEAAIRALQREAYATGGVGAQGLLSPAFRDQQ